MEYGSEYEEDDGGGGTEMDPLMTPETPAAERALHQADSFYEHLGDYDDEPQDGISTFSAIVIAVNMIVGAGILGLPYAFYTSGAWLATGVLAVSTGLTGVTVGYLIECTGWCEGLEVAEEAEKLDSLVGQLDPPGGEVEEVTDAGYNPRRFKIRSKKFEMSEMCGKLLANEDGKQVYRKFFEFVLFSYTFGSCWLYASVFASTLSMLVQLPAQEGLDIAHCWDKCSATDEVTCQAGCVWANASSTCVKDPNLAANCWASYRVFLLVFFGVQVVLSCSSLHTFKNIQIFFSAWVFSAIAIMVGTSISAVATDTPADDAYDRVPPFNPSKIVTIVSSGLFAQMCHQGVPAVVRMTKNKQQSKTVFYSSLAYTLLLYTLLGFSTSYHLGPKTNPIITLNWDSFRGGAKDGDPVPAWANIARWIVVLFPVFTVSAGFSLQVLPLSETLISLMPKPPPVDPSFTRRPSVLALQEASSRFKSISLRVLLSFLPIVCAALLRDVVRILEFNGIFGFVIAFFTPCFLQLSAFSTAKAKFGANGARNPYWDVFSAPPAVQALLSVCSILFVVVAYQTVLDYLQPE